MQSSDGSCTYAPLRLWSLLNSKETLSRTEKKNVWICFTAKGRTRQNQKNVYWQLFKLGWNHWFTYIHVIHSESHCALCDCKSSNTVCNCDFNPGMNRNYATIPLQVLTKCFCLVIALTVLSTLSAADRSTEREQSSLNNTLVSSNPKLDKYRIFVGYIM